MLLDYPRPNFVRKMRYADNDEDVRQNVENHLNVSVRRRSQQLNLTYGSTWRI